MDAVQDIADAIINPAFRHSAQTLSTSELRRKVTKITRIDGIWDAENLEPAKVDHYEVDPMVQRVEVVHGGKYILEVTRDGTLSLYKSHDITQVLSKVSRDDADEDNTKHDCHYFPECTDLRRSCSSSGRHWAVVMDYYVTVK